MDVAVAIDAEAVPVTFFSRAPGSYTAAGRGVPGVVTTTPGHAAIQPVSGSVLRDLPEGIRGDVSYVGWSRTMVKVGWEVVYAGENHRVLHTWPRPMDGFTKFAMGEVTP